MSLTCMTKTRARISSVHFGDILHTLSRLVIFAVVFFGTILLDQAFLLIEQMPVMMLVYFFWFTGVYLLLLYFEIRSKIKKMWTTKQIRWAGFWFTFCVSSCWDLLLLSLSYEELWFMDPLSYFAFLLMFASSGGAFGLVGMAITQFMLLGLFRYDDRS